MNSSIRSALRKRLFFVVSVFIFIGTGNSLVFGECIIEWVGDESGSIITQETSRTLQAARQLERALLPAGPGFIAEDCGDGDDPYFPHCPGCRATKPGWLVDVCLDGSYIKRCLYSNPECGWTHNGTWDVVCDGTTTSTIIETTTVAPTTTTSVPPVTYWAKTYHGNSIRNAHSAIVKQTSDGGYIMAGDALFDGSSYGDIAVLKLDRNGDVVWQKAFSGTGTSGDEAADIIQTSEGGYILVGSLFNTIGGTAFWVLKLDADGNTSWQQMFGGSHEDYPHNIIQTADGGYIIAGSTYSFGAGNSDIWVLKLTSNGSVSWQKVYGGPGYEFGDSIQQTSDGQYVITGSTMSSSGNRTADILVIRLDQNGNILWQKTYAGSQYDSASAIQETPDGGYIISGGTYSFGAGNEDVFVLKLDENGNIIWQKTYGGTSNDFANNIIRTPDNCYTVAANTYSFPVINTLSNILLFKIDDEGTLLWQKTYGGSGIDFVRSIQQTEDGGFLAGGSSSSFDEYVVFFVLKLDAYGDIPVCNIIGSSYAISSDANFLITNGNLTAMSPIYSSSTYPSSRILSLEDSLICPGSTVINLSSFFAIQAAGKVSLNWSTESETDNAGFNVYRSKSENGEYHKINDFLIPAKGSSTQGASYEFIDKNVQNRKTYYYKLEDIDVNGASTFHGPISATPRLIYGFGK